MSALFSVIYSYQSKTVSGSAAHNIIVEGDIALNEAKAVKAAISNRIASVFGIKNPTVELVQSVRIK